MGLDPNRTPKIVQITLELSQYPILARRIRQRMREELFDRGVVTAQRLEEEARARALESQRREGLTDPMLQEPANVWQTRLEHFRESLTDFYFAYNLPHDLFKQIVEEAVAARSPQHPVVLSFNPELAPWDLLFQQAEAYEAAPQEDRAKVQHHLQEIIAVLIKTMISDQLAFVGVARRYLTIADLKYILSHRFGRGKIGGKSAGMFLAYKVLQTEGRARGLDVDDLIRIPESWFLGSDVYYDFKSENDLFPFMNQKYKTPEQMMRDYPAAYEATMRSRLPGHIEDDLRGLLEYVGNAPLIVRSSSLLEDNFDKSFAGKYDSYFLPNQGTFDENLAALTDAVIKVYASVVNPGVLIYRLKMGLIDYDERMAVLIQKVEGQQYGRYFFPALAGVAFSRNPYRWNKRIIPEQGLLRLVAGLGTRAVDRVGGDYPRMVALSHPTLRPEKGAPMLRHYSQHHIDVIDLDDNEVKTLNIRDVVGLDYPALGVTMSVEQEGLVRALSSRPLTLDRQQMIVTFDHLLEQKQFVSLMRDVLATLEEAYQRPVDTEFAGEVLKVYPRPKVRVTLLQCRPLSQSHPRQTPTIPILPEKDVLFSSGQRQAPNGAVDQIRYIVYVDPHAYAGIDEPDVRIEIARVVGRINQALAGQRFILMGPGRWGSSNIHLGVKVTYADIYNTAVLIEIAYQDGGGDPEVSYGTHFFQDLVEANIYPLPIYPDDPGAIFREDFFGGASNVLAELLPEDAAFAEYVKVIDLPALDGCTLTILMSSEEDKAVGFLERAET